MTKIAYFTDTFDGSTHFIGVFDSKDDKEHVAAQINKAIEDFKLFDTIFDCEVLWEIGRTLVYTEYAEYKSYKFYTEYIKEL